MTDSSFSKRRTAVALSVIRKEQLTPHMIRVVFGGPGVVKMVDNDFTDHYVKLQFPPQGVTYPQPVDLEWVKANLPREQWPTLRTYTLRAFDPQRGELTIDFVHHGDDGVAGPWAAKADPGDELALLGPGGAYAPDPDADWHLLIGDESAIPAISNALERMAFDVKARVVIEVGSVDDEQKLPTRADAKVTWLLRGEAMPGSTDLLIDHVRSMSFDDGTVQVFAHGEGHAIMKQLRPHLFHERGVPPEQVSISGYWRQGRTEEQFREWKAKLRAEDEAAAEHDDSR